jgi:hypothetical protein
MGNRVAQTGSAAGKGSEPGGVSPEGEHGDAFAPHEHGEQELVMAGAIVLVPVGPVPADLVEWLAGSLRAIVGQEVVVAEGIPLPEKAFDPQRRQYRGDGVLAGLQALGCPGADRDIGLV